ncbi:hypothetical protein [Actinorugispora endophytica]|uniref:Uncharacterized protein n=1 Tax=Actinorugispora endophytica TaxID=1605990 RepID=A0A4R6UVX1_9ACTN|nr:hypothetical protein [Actinorugispora endophytica]TDQ50003.1 hypothetical protein EV190_11447 [Actinorugispora endophytica]
MTDKSKGEPDKANSSALSADWGSLTARPAASPDTDAGQASAPKSLRPGGTEDLSAPPPTEPGTRADAATATAADTAEAGRPQIDAVGARAVKPLAPVDASPRPGRPGSPVLAGAAIAGLLLIAAPFAVSAGVQGVSLDIVPLSGGGPAGDDEQTGDERQTGSEQDTSSDGSGTGGQGGSADQGQADSGGAPDGGGGGGVNNAPDPGPGYVPEAMEQQAGIPSSSPEDGGGSGGGEQETGGAGSNVAAGGGGDSSKGSSRTADKDDSGNGGGSQAAGGSEDADTPANGGIINDLPDVNTAGSDKEEEEERQEQSGDEEDSNQRSAPSDDSGDQEAGTFSALSDSSPSAEERQPSPSGEPSNSAPSPSGDPSPSADPSPSGAPSPSGDPSPSASPSASPSGDRYSALAGPGCATDGGAYGQAGSWYPENSTAGWATREGGHDQDGCAGGYDAIPVSGDPEHGDGQFAYWTFSPGYADAECELYVHVPDDESPLWIGEQEARYQIFPRDKAEGDAVAVFGINQSQVKGGWVQVTGFTSPAEQFTVQLTNIGENPLAGQENTSTHVAASAVRATCS